MSTNIEKCEKDIAFEFNKTGFPLKNAKHEILCQVYAKTLDVGEAQKACGMTRLTCIQMLRRNHIRKRLDELLNLDDDYYIKTKIKAVAEIANIAFTDFHEIFDLDKMELRAAKKIDGRIIQSCKMNKDGQLEVKLCDKLKALELLGRHLGMFQDKVDVTSKGESINIVVNSQQVSEALDEAIDD